MDCSAVQDLTVTVESYASLLSNATKYMETTMDRIVFDAITGFRVPKTITLKKTNSQRMRPARLHRIENLANESLNYLPNI